MRQAGKKWKGVEGGGKLFAHEPGIASACPIWQNAEAMCGWRFLEIFDTVSSESAANFPLKKGSRIFKQRAPNWTSRFFGSQSKGMLAAPAGAASKELGGKIKRRDEIPRNNFFGNEVVRHNEVMYKNKFLFQYFAQNIPLRGIKAIFHSLAEHLPADRQVSHAKI